LSGFPRPKMQRRLFYLLRSATLASTLPPLLRCSSSQARPSDLNPCPFSHAPFSSLRLDLPHDSPLQEGLPAYLAARLPAWRTQGVNCVWITLHLPTHAPLLGALVGPSRLNFVVHHARGQTCTLMQWLPSAPCKVPPYASTQVAVGGVCVDAAGRFLLIRERAAAANAWKFPGGMSDPGENIPDCAVREVFEETGVRTRFEGLLALRHMHRVAFGVSDLYFLALLRPLEPSAPAQALDAEIRIDPGEIAASTWTRGAQFAAETPHPLMARVAAEALGVARARGWIREEGPLGDSALFSPEPTGSLALSNVFSAINKKWTQIYLASSRPLQQPSEETPSFPIRPPPWER
jgi:8-oxo-dGTP pyrophosphatase MutT (NUDIX family)